MGTGGAGHAQYNTATDTPLAEPLTPHLTINSLIEHGRANGVTLVDASGDQLRRNPADMR